jgi:hypothetical protein
MKTFHWNEVKEQFKFWDPEGEVSGMTLSMSNKEVVDRPNGVKFEDALRALCAVVSELVAIEEGRD